MFALFVLFLIFEDETVIGTTWPLGRAKKNYSIVKIKNPSDENIFPMYLCLNVFNVTFVQILELR